jgi:hypothetical protein
MGNLKMNNVRLLEKEEWLCGQREGAKRERDSAKP